MNARKMGNSTEVAIYTSEMLLILLAISDYFSNIEYKAS